MATVAVQSGAIDDTEEEWADDSNQLLNFLTRFGAAPAWVVSLTIHMFVLMLLSTVVYYPPTQLLQNVLSTEMSHVEDEPVVMDAVEVDKIGSNSDTLVAGASMASALLKGDNPQTEVEEKVGEQFSPVEVAHVDSVEMPAASELVGTVNKVGSAATENTGGTEGAIDRLTFELLQAVKDRKTLVLWMFDASLSLEARRGLIADRFENVYRQLDALDSSATKHLKTAVATFGEKTNILTPEPVDGIQTVVPMIRKIKNDISGKENTFASVVQVYKKFQSYARNSRRKTMMIIVTDEKGDDAIQYLEEAIHVLSHDGAKCFVVGTSAPFGKEKGFHVWTYPDGGTEEVAVDQGPETVYPDSLRLPFVGINAYDLEKMSSGYGPYALTRLCAETGGVYLIAEETNGKRYDPAIMRNYQPDYRQIAVQEKEKKKNKAKYSLVDTASRLMVDNIPNPTLTFPANNDNELREAITEAQKPWAVADQFVNAMLANLELGEKDREKITEPRWQAAFDLAMGRANAVRARTLGYNMILAEMKLNPKPFTKKGNNQWILKPGSHANAVPDIKKKATKATMYLKRVIDQHPGTPWADLAERELSQPMGWEWTEGADASARLAMASPEEKKAMLLLADEQKKKQAMRMEKQAKRQPPKL